MIDINVPKGCKIIVCGDIHGHDKQFFDLINKIGPSSNTWFVSVGDLIDKGFGQHAEEKIIIKIYELTKLGIGFFTPGNHELKALRKHITKNKPMSEELKWLARQPLGLSFVFSNQTRLTIVHGGVKPKHTWNDLSSNSDLVYIRTLDEDGEYIPLKWIELEDGTRTLKAKKSGKPWHELYDGRFGYIASGHDAQKDGVAKFYKHSCNLDTACYATGVLTAQVFSESGREDLLQANGPAANKVPVFDTKP